MGSTGVAKCRRFRAPKGGVEFHIDDELRLGITRGRFPATGTLSDMTDQPGQVATGGDETDFTLTIEQAAERYVGAGHPRTAPAAVIGEPPLISSARLSCGA